MKKVLLSIIAVFMLLSAGEHVNSNVPIAEAAYYNPIKKAGYNYYYRGSCVYYAFNRRAQLKRPVSNAWGSAKYWPNNARRMGYKVSRTPVKGSVLISQLGYHGHAAVVERINRNGSILVSEMNFPRSGVKTYRTISKSQRGQYQYIY